MRREACGVSCQVQVHTEATRLVWPAHRDLRECDAKSSMRAVVRRAEQAPLRARDEKGDETLLGFEVHERRLPADEIVADLPVRRTAEFRARLTEQVHGVAGRASKALYGALDAGQEADHADDGRRVHRTGRALIVERD